MPTRSHTASLRRSVVSIAAAFAVAPACSVDHASNDKDVDQINPPACEEGSTETRCGAPVDCPDAGGCSAPPDSFECPAQAPYDGDPCDDTSGAVCTYPCDVADAHLEVTCVDGSWNVDEGAGCVMSQPDPQPEECPEVPPEDHTPCDIPAGIDCFYGECNGEPQIEVSCISQEIYEKGPVADLWFVFDKGCRPPPQCPDEPPAVGSSCPQHGDSCRYNTDPQDCPENGWNFEVTCFDSSWVDSHESHFCETPGGEKG